MHWLASTTLSALGVIALRAATLADSPGDAAGQTITTLALAALLNVLVEFVKRWQSRAQQAKDVADGAEVLVDAAGKLVTSQNTTLDRFAAQVLALDARIKAQDERIDKLGDEVAERDERLEAQDKVIDTLKRDKDAPDDWVRRLTNNQEANIARIKDLDKEVARLKREREESDATQAQDKAQMTAELRALSNGIDQLTTQLRQLGHTPAWERGNGTGVQS